MCLENLVNKKVCKACREIQNSCTDCTKNQAYKLLQTGMVGGPAIVFCRYHERDITSIRSQVYEEPETSKTVLGLDANMLYPSILLQDFPCGKEKLLGSCTEIEAQPHVVNVRCAEQRLVWVCTSLHRFAWRIAREIQQSVSAICGYRNIK